MKRLARLTLLLLTLAVASPVWATPPTLDYETITKTATVLGSSTDATLWTPTTGNRFVLQGCVINSQFAGKVELEVSDVDVIPPIKFQSTGTIVIGFGYAPIYVSAEDAVLTYTTDPGTYSILCVGYEEAVLD